MRVEQGGLMGEAKGAGRVDRQDDKRGKGTGRETENRMVDGW